jgi:hypothetical protein
MSNKFRDSRLFLLFLQFLLVMSACKTSEPFVYRTISKGAIIDTNEQEIVFDSPFKPKKMVNKVCFEYTDNLIADKSGTLSPKFPDGLPLQLNVFVLDQNGRKYALDHIENSFENYHCILPSDKSWLEISKTNTTFVKLVVSSNRKINISLIQWVSYDIWDI